LIFENCDENYLIIEYNQLYNHYKTIDGLIQVEFDKWTDPRFKGIEFKVGLSIIIAVLSVLTTNLPLLQSIKMCLQKRLKLSYTLQMVADFPMVCQLYFQVFR